MTSEQQKATDNYRSAIEKSVENDEQIGRYGNSPNWNRTEAERLQERGRQLDENEATAKAEYERLGCDKETGHDAESFRHDVISKKTEREYPSHDSENDHDSDCAHDEPDHDNGSRLPSHDRDMDR